MKTCLPGPRACPAPTGSAAGAEPEAPRCLGVSARNRDHLPQKQPRGRRLPPSSQCPGSPAPDVPGAVVLLEVRGAQPHALLAGEHLQGVGVDGACALQGVVGHTLERRDGVTARRAGRSRHKRQAGHSSSMTKVTFSGNRENTGEDEGRRGKPPEHRGQRCTRPPKRLHSLAGVEPAASQGPSHDGQ